ncbi:hypothetical protein ACFW1M_23740 [Streptomyces inhibens]|uniref:hypothetical protein n=1 Tax=Streptomyces inhibens TaxID=2293571 RepID=UPI0036A256F5
MRALAGVGDGGEKLCVSPSAAPCSVPAALEQAVLTLAKERQRTVQLLEDTKLWRREAEDAAQRGRDLQKLVELARHRLRDMGPEQQAQVLDLLEIQVTILGGIPRKVRSDDGVSTWFRERARRVPLLTDDAWVKIESIFVDRKGRRLRDPRGTLDAMLYQARTGVLGVACPLRRETLRVYGSDG